MASSKDDVELQLMENEKGADIANSKPSSSPPTPAPKEEHTVWVIGGAVSFYFVTSMSLVFLNKFVLKNYDFPLPLFVTWFQFVIALICMLILGNIGKFWKPLSFVKAPGFTLADWDYDTLLKVLPLTLLFVSMVCFSNLTLRFAEVSFYQVARSLTICFSIIFTYYFLNESTSWKELQPCGVVIIGFLMGVEGEANFAWGAVIFGVLSSVFVASYGIKVKNVIRSCGGDTWLVTLYNTAQAIVVMLPVVYLSGEMDQFFSCAVIYDYTFWLFMIFAGIVGFLINIAMFYQINVTSPLTGTVSGTVKACVQTALGVLIWQNAITLMNFLGIMLVIGGSMWYSLVRYWKMQQK
eukprot:TRINITY_DN1289_c0_g1_i1.p1 TRINITY_DN1289_c0_g1~~TRINITY_DN1289_c0_g1_i1.p1  ORF type:complete len:352 (+),score=51.57 TRINITY_DN1289_c0_g1_i1:107-1162(+)